VSRSSPTPPFPVIAHARRLLILFPNLARSCVAGAGAHRPQARLAPRLPPAAAALASSPLAARLRAAPWPVERRVPVVARRPPHAALGFACAVAPSARAPRGRAPELAEQELWNIKSEGISSLYFNSLLILILTSRFTISILSFLRRVLNF
jgi:hypothetical protein